ncbi:hypothetical protein JCM10213v2_008713 [Rhodosporidiobolus nylandii]
MPADPASPSLLDLPAELFLLICQDVKSSRKGPYLGAVSKAFLPFAREQAFSRVFVYRPALLERFCDVVHLSPGVAPYVKELTIFLYLAGEPDVKTKTVLALFRQLIAVTSFTLSGSTNLAKAVLSPAVNARLLPALKKLKVTDSLDGWSQPFDPAHYAGLASYKNLNSLELTVNRTYESLGRYKPSSARLKTQSKWWSPSWWIDLSGPLALNPALPDFLAFFPSIDGLCLAEAAGGSESRSFAPALAALHSPRTLTVLSLGQTAERSQELSLSRFSSLKVFELRNKVLSPVVLSSLSTPSSRLEHLILGPSTGVSDEQLKSLVSGPSAISSLKRVSLNELRDDGWEYRGWSSAFTRKGVEELLELSEKAEVVLDGVAVELAREAREMRRKQEERKKSKPTAEA